MRARGMAVAKRRTESARSRVPMKIPEVNRRAPTPKRVSSRV